MAGADDQRSNHEDRRGPGPVQWLYLASRPPWKLRDEDEQHHPQHQHHAGEEPRTKPRCFDCRLNRVILRNPREMRDDQIEQRHKGRDQTKGKDAERKGYPYAECQLSAMRPNVFAT